LDPSGDIFISNTASNQIVEVTAGGSAAALSITVTSGLNTPLGIAVDIFGSLYIADSLNNRIVKVLAGSTTGTVVSFGELTALHHPSGVAVDRVGNIFVADTTNNRVAEVDTSSEGTSLLNSINLETETFTAPLGVAVDVFGAVYIADTGANRGLIVDPLTGAGSPSSLNKSAVGFGHLPLGTMNGTTLTLTVSVGYGEALGSTPFQVFTAGAANQDFTAVAGENTTCSNTTGVSEGSDLG
jgi:sugar lactone lactonase YvrE